MSIFPYWAVRVLAEIFQLIEKAISFLQGLGGMSPQLLVATWPGENVAHCQISWDLLSPYKAPGTVLSAGVLHLI